MTAPTPERILQRLDWRVIRRLDGLLQGDYRTLFYGAGVDFADLRDYEPRDDIRHIDWNVTARMNSPYVRQYVEDREVTAWFLLDLSPSMSFGPVDRPKSTILIDFVTAMARLLTRNGNRVGAILYDNRSINIIPPRGGKNQVLRLTRTLLNHDGAPVGHSTDLNKLIQAGLNSVKRRSLIFIVSDFISELGWERPLAHLNQRHELLAIRLFDPQETALPDAGVLVIEDAETGEQLYVDTSNPTFRQNFLTAAQRRTEMLTAKSKRAGVPLFEISTEENVIGAIVRMVRLRKKI